MRAWKPKLLIPFFCPQSDEAQVTIKWLWLGKKNNLVLGKKYNMVSGLISNSMRNMYLRFFSVSEILQNSSDFQVNGREISE